MVLEFGYGASKRTPERRASGDQFIVEDLLDFSNDDGVVFDEGNSNSNSNSSDSSLVVTPPDSGNSFSGNNDAVVFPTVGDTGSHGYSDTHFSGELCVPCDDLAELEWFSNFMEESFSSEDLQKFNLVSGISSAMKTRPESSSEIRYYQTEPPRPENPPNVTFNPEIPVPGKARSKRSRAAPCNWTSRLIVLSDGSPSPDQNHPIQPVATKPVKAASKKKGVSGSGSGSGYGSGSDLPNGEVRRCVHCATDKTPQWRTGPTGPKTLCNACGVRYKSGRLVPEYRPAASPTFVLAKHSNSHRKVMELRRQKDLMRQQQQQYHQQQLMHHSSHHPSNMLFDPDDYLIHQQIGSDYRQLI
ncbi:GATA transcription factor 12-like [Silene latifolia]|uniref:GATA transcription factor 12-like n=1 Tax=Silene latifolia TaxID=37657 RepID=UPI003D76B679